MCRERRWGREKKGKKEKGETEDGEREVIFPEM